MIAVLATWRLSRLLATERGPWDVVARLRRLAGGGVLGQLMDCFGCLSLWVAAPLTLVVGATGALEIAVTWLAISGGAILVEQRLGTPTLLEEGTINDVLPMPPAVHAKREREEEEYRVVG